MSMVDRKLCVVFAIIVLITMMDHIVNRQTSPVETMNVTLCNIPNPPVKPLLALSWTAKRMDSDSHSEVWFGDGNDPDTTFKACYEQKIINPKIYPCQYTNNRARLNESEVVFFRGRRLSEVVFPKHRRRDQQWLFFDFEPPYKVWRHTNLTEFNGVFNLTSTYSRDSDIPHSPQIKNCVKQPSRYNQTKYVDYSAKKRRDVPVAWFASVCRTQSKREQYVHELQKYIGVDVYGKCGDLDCGTNRPLAWREEKCDEMLLHGNDSYMFYLAFENSLCDDYITEKFWRMLKIDIVPIVMSKVDFSNIMPKDSFIDVRDFPSPRALARYLRLLMADKPLYNNYIRNKNCLACTPIQPTIPLECHFCKRLHETRGRNKIVHDLAEFWGNRRCITQDQLLEPLLIGVFDIDSKMSWNVD